MAHARRVIAILIGCAAWCIASAAVASASMLHDPVPTAPPVVTSPGAGGSLISPFLVFVALWVLLAVAIVGLGYALSHSRRRQPSTKSPRSHDPLTS
jgi:predicted alpha/beta-hydrolase family hydrolase